MKTVLVTGGAGFIGSNLCESLLTRGYNVVCLDNFSTGRIGNIRSLLNEYPDRFELVEGDIRDLEVCRKAVQRVDIILHEAALGSVPRSIEDPITSNTVNIGGFLNMLFAAKEVDVERFIFASSSSTYGDSISLPKVEEYVGTPQSPYALTKYVNEQYAHLFSVNYGLKYIGIRYFNVFGRRQDPNSNYAAVIPTFIKKLQNYEQPVIYGDGSNSRDFTYIDNIVHINMLAIETQNPKALNQIYNGACGESISIIDLERLIAKLLSKHNPSISAIEPIFGPPRAGDVRHSLASIDKAYRLLGYEPVCDFLKGLEATIEWYKGQ